jgi:hypothetical protein
LASTRSAAPAKPRPGREPSGGQSGWMETPSSSHLCIRCSPCWRR